MWNERAEGGRILILATCVEIIFSASLSDPSE